MFSGQYGIDDSSFVIFWRGYVTYSHNICLRLLIKKVTDIVHVLPDFLYRR